MKRFQSILLAVLAALLLFTGCGATGSSASISSASYRSDSSDNTDKLPTEKDEYTYILNTRTMKVHLPDCEAVGRMNEENKQGSNASEAELTAEGYVGCKICCPFDAEESAVDYSKYDYVLNTRTMKVHLPDCEAVGKMAAENKLGSNASESELTAEGYIACKKCHPFGYDTEDSSSSANDYSSYTVYVSNNGKIHTNPNCSGMKYYTEMTYAQAKAYGYVECKKCY